MVSFAPAAAELAEPEAVLELLLLHAASASANAAAAATAANRAAA